MIGSGTISQLLLAPFTFTFMQHATLGTLAVGLAAPICGCWAVSRRLVYLSDAMSHAILAGVAGAALLSANLLLGGFTAAVLMALLVALLVVRARVPEDAAIGVAGQGLFALGVIGVSLQNDPRALSHILFGNPLTVSGADVMVQWLMTGVVVAAGWFLAPVLAATTFDPVHARTAGVRVGLIDTALIVGLALVVVIGLTTVGVLMALTLAVAPAVSARMLADRMSMIIPIAVVLGVGAGMFGLLLSFHTSLPTGPLVALAAVGQVAITATVRAMKPATSHRVIVSDHPGTHIPH
jgi:ABC-type Mn2+/Zn2+ transport system permease subunit